MWTSFRKGGWESLQLFNFLATANPLATCRVSKGRKKRSVPEGWATADQISSFDQLNAGKIEYHPSTLAVDDDTATIGTVEGDVSIYSLKEGQQKRVLHIGEPLTGTIGTGAKVIYATLKGSVMVYENGEKQFAFSEHAGAVTGISLHPGLDILASVGLDKSIVFYSMEERKKVLRMYTDSRKYHQFQYPGCAGIDR